MLLGVTHPGDDYLVMLSNYGIMITGCGISHYYGTTSCTVPGTSKKRELLNSVQKDLISDDPLEPTSKSAEDIDFWLLGRCMIARMDDSSLEIIERSGRRKSIDLTTLESGDSDDLECTHYIVGHFVEGAVTYTTPTSSIWYMSEFIRSYRNHAAYCEHRGCNSVVSIVSDEKLKGRSRKFSKHFALRSLVSRSEWSITCTVDADGWFASWDHDLEEYIVDWPEDKEIMVPFSGQFWFNSGFFCLRNTAFSVTFAQSVLDALHNSTHRIGFRRDQPAMWHVLASLWGEEGLITYRGHACPYWVYCSVDSGPLDCWHLCFWKPLSAARPWKLPESANRLTHVYMPDENAIVTQKASDIRRLPQLHRMCLRSCGTTLAQLWTLSCLKMLRHSEKSECYPNNAEDKLQCGVTGCLNQLGSGSGAFFKHTGRRFWTEALAEHVPLSHEEAKKEEDLLL